MDDLGPLRTYLAQAAPRHGGEEFLAQANERVGRTGRALLVFGVVGMVIFEAIAVSAGWPDHVLDTVVQMAVLGGLLLTFILGAAYLYLRQDLSTGRRLLRLGRSHEGEVVATSVDARGMTWLTVRWDGDQAAGQPFQTYLDQARREALVGVAAVVIEHEKVKAAFVPGLGLVATR